MSRSLEKHVTDALWIADELADARPIDAGDLLTAAYLVQTRGDRTSQAFSHLASLLPVQEACVPKVLYPFVNRDRSIDPFDKLQDRFSSGLEAAYAASAPFLSAGKTVWGRDYITLAILAHDDPALA